MKQEVYINNITAFLPNEPVSNDEMETVLGQTGERPSRARRTVLRSNGIKQRYYAIDKNTGETTHNNAQLTAEAVRQLNNKHFDINTTNCLVCGTTTPDQLMPNHAVMVQGELKIPPCEVVATAGVCLSGITALKYAWLGVRSGEFSSAIATGSEVSSSMTRGKQFSEELESQVLALKEKPEIAFEKDFLRWMLSDGAGAMLLQPQPAPKGLSLRLDWIFERSYANEMDTCMYAGAEKQQDGSLKGWKEYEPRQWLDESVFSIKQDIKQLNEKIIYYTVERILEEIQQQKAIKPEQIDWFLPHYSSNFFRDKVYAGMQNVNFEIPFERWYTNLSEKGNTGAASMYIMLEELFSSGKLQPNQTLLCYIPESGRFSSAFMHLTVCQSK
jgi:3-oxoacyl-[acyl-carrier-protein] synthase-3